jgi:hypothetical protein
VGAALLAAVGTGGQVNIETGVREVVRAASTLEPGPHTTFYNQLFAQYERARAVLIPGSVSLGSVGHAWPVYRQH